VLEGQRNSAERKRRRKCRCGCGKSLIKEHHARQWIRGHRIFFLKYLAKVRFAEVAGIDCFLTLEEYIALVRAAGITPDDIAPNKYHLARYGDKGVYEVGNCRFIHYTENIKEKKVSRKQSSAARTTIMDVNNVRSAKAASRKWNHKVNRTNVPISRKEISRRLRLISESGIDLTKYGWVVEVSCLLGLSHTQTRRFVNKYYDGKTYTRQMRT